LAAGTLQPVLAALEQRFYEPNALRQRLAGMGWDAQVQVTPEFFIYGHATRASERVEHP
jgi:hypothetical protein